MIKGSGDLNLHGFAVECIKQIWFAVVFAVAEKLAVQLERPQQLIADGFSWPSFTSFCFTRFLLLTSALNARQIGAAKSDVKGCRNSNRQLEASAPTGESRP